MVWSELTDNQIRLKIRQALTSQTKEKKKKVKTEIVLETALAGIGNKDNERSNVDDSDVAQDDTDTKGGVVLMLEKDEIRGNVESLVLNIDGQESNQVLVGNDAVDDNVESVVEGNVGKRNDCDNNEEKRNDDDKNEVEKVSDVDDENDNETRK